MKKFSVIIPTFNRAHILQRAIDSVFEQTFIDFDLWIVDDGSTDETSELVKKYPTIHYIKTFNRGVSAARNLAVEKSSSEWLSFLDSDDQWLKNKLEVQNNYILENPSISLVHGEEIWIRNGKRVNPKKKHKKSGGDILESCLNMCLISPSATVIKRSLFDQMGGFLENYKTCEDYDLWLKICSLYPVGFIEEPIIKKFGGHEDQLSAKYFAMDFNRIKSLRWLLNNRKLDQSIQIKILEIIETKKNILIKGAIKNNNKSLLNELKSF